MAMKLSRACIRARKIRLSLKEIAILTTSLDTYLEHATFDDMRVARTLLNRINAAKNIGGNDDIRRR